MSSSDNEHGEWGNWCECEDDCGSAYSQNEQGMSRMYDGVGTVCTDGNDVDKGEVVESSEWVGYRRAPHHVVVASAATVGYSVECDRRQC